MKMRAAAALIACAAAIASAADRAEAIRKPEEPSAAPAPESFRSAMPREGMTTLVLPEVAIDAKRAIERALAPHEIGFSRRAEVAARARIDETSVRWQRAGAGFAAHIAVTSVGAAGLRLGIRFDAMPDALEIRVAQPSADGSPRVVATTRGAALRKLARGAWPVEHWSASTEGETQWIELWIPRRADAAELRFRVQDVSHFLQAVGAALRPKTEFACHVDIACVSDANVQADSHAVARMLFTKDGRSGLCTGSLLADRVGSMTPLFATANHCISTSSAAASLETWWFFYPTTCGGSPQAPTRLSGGASLLVADFDMDFALMRLAQAAPGGATFLGWDATALSAGQPVFGIHHPNGEAQRYSAGNFVARGHVTDSATHITFRELFNRVTLTQGIVEGGSSGSPLLTAPSVFHGTLFGTPTTNACGASNNSASYSDFTVIYPMISTFLGGPNAADDHADGPANATRLSPVAKLVAQMNHSADADWFRFDFTSGGDWTIASFDPVSGEGLDVRGEVYGADGSSLVASSDDRSPTDLNFEIALHLDSASTYYLRVVAFQGAVGRYGVRSTFVRPDEHGDTPATATPLAPNGTASGILGISTDQDWFRVTFDGPGTFHVNSTGTTDTMGALYQADGVTLIAQNDDANPPDTNFGITASVAGAGTLFLKVTGFDGDIGEYGIQASFTAGAGASNYTDLWWNAPSGSESGWGVNLNHQSETIFATLFSYAADGRDLWLVASGLARQPNGSFTGPLYRTTGPAFNASPWTSIAVTQVGTMTLTFAGASQATLAYSMNGVSVTKTITRQVFGTPPACVFTTGSRTGATNYQDLWWNPAESGWGINLTHQGGTMFATLFTYAADNRDLWLVASGLARQADGSFSGALYRTTGPAFNASPWSQIGVTEVGTMRLAFSGGNSGTLTYTFNGVTVTKSIQRQVFGAEPTLCQ